MANRTSRALKVYDQSAVATKTDPGEPADLEGVRSHESCDKPAKGKIRSDSNVLIHRRRQVRASGEITLWFRDGQVEGVRVCRS